jgi:hypothetical protein
MASTVPVQRCVGLNQLCCDITRHLVGLITSVVAYDHKKLIRYYYEVNALDNNYSHNFGAKKAMWKYYRAC